MTSDEESKLKQIYRLMYNKLSEIQLNHAFDKTMEENRQFSYVDKPDDYFFSKMISVVFESGVRAVVWMKYAPEIRKEFADYNVKKVAEYTDKDVERMLDNPKMFKNRRKIEACVHNAKEIVELSEQYGGFYNFLSQHSTAVLIEKLRQTFKHFNYTNSYAFLKYVGAEVIKPDLNVRRIMYRLGLIDSKKNNKKVWTQVQEVGRKMAEAVGVRVIEVDYLFYLYGSGGVKAVPYQVCGVKPKCEECELKPFCRHQ